MMIFFGIIGPLIISTAVWQRNEKKQDHLFIIGGLFLLVYSLYIQSWIFAILQIIFVVSAFTEIIKKKVK